MGIFENLTARQDPNSVFARLFGGNQAPQSAPLFARQQPGSVAANFADFIRPLFARQQPDSVAAQLGLLLGILPPTPTPTPTPDATGGAVPNRLPGDTGLSNLAPRGSGIALTTRRPITNAERFGTVLPIAGGGFGPSSFANAKLGLARVRNRRRLNGASRRIGVQQRIDPFKP